MMNLRGYYSISSTHFLPLSRKFKEIAQSSWAMTENLENSENSNFQKIQKIQPAKSPILAAYL